MKKHLFAIKQIVILESILTVKILGYTYISHFLFIILLINCVHFIISNSPKKILEFPKEHDGGQACFSILIIGAGMAGLCMGSMLKMSGFHNFVIVDKEKEIGGTWCINTYPGVGCDIITHLYSFSFYMNPWWSKLYAKGDEIKRYLEELVKNYLLSQNLMLDHCVLQIVWQEYSKNWIVSVKSNQGHIKKFSSSVVIQATGALHIPNVPKIKGAKRFKGSIFHSTEFESSFDLRNKVVGIIGTGASAIQIIPEISDNCKRLVVFQRTPSWVPPKGEFISLSQFGVLHFIFWLIPCSMSIYRLWCFVYGEMIFYITSDPRTLRHYITQKILTSWMSFLLKQDKFLTKNLIPNYPLGYKRITPSDHYLQTFLKQNVHLEVNSISSIDEDGVIVSNTSNRDEHIGITTKHPVDIIIMATGFNVKESIGNPFKAFGVNGKELHELWFESSQDANHSLKKVKQIKGPSAYYGISIPDFPNFFMLFGPNSAASTNSMLYMIECQCGYILQCLHVLSQEMKVSKVASMNLRQESLDGLMKTYERYFEGTALNPTKTILKSCWFLKRGERNWFSWPTFCYRYGFALFKASFRKEIWQDYSFS